MKIACSLIGILTFCLTLNLAILTPQATAQQSAQTASYKNLLDGPTLPSFRFPLEAQTPRKFNGGTAQEATIKNFPVSQGIAGVSMRLDPGGLRELHWHANAAEWAYIIKGHCRITVIDPQMRTEVKDFGPGDIWYFPRGHGHSIQGLGNEECHFILVFDNGAFSDFATFSISDWIAQTPPEVLAKNFKVPADVFKNFPKKEVYISKGAVPTTPLPSEFANYSLNSPPLTHKYQLRAQQGKLFDGGTFQLASRKEFPISTTMSGAVQTLKPNAMRELHWHPNANEWQYYISGHARMSVFGSGGRSHTDEFGPGDVGYVPQGYGHYIENAGNEDCQTLIVLDSGNYEEISLAEWMRSNTPELLETNFGVPKSIFDSFPRNNGFVTEGGK